MADERLNSDAGKIGTTSTLAHWGHSLVRSAGVRIARGRRMGRIDFQALINEGFGATSNKIAPGLARLFYYSTLAVRFGVVLIALLSLIIFLQNRDGQWSLIRTPTSAIPMNMHGSVVYLTARQKFIYYDAFGC